MSNAHEILRKEAAAVSFVELTESQREAVDKLSKFLQEALEASDHPPDEDRRSRVVLVSGGKGCGKTSLVHSLRRLMERRDVYNEFGNAGGNEPLEKAKARSPRVKAFLTLRDQLTARFGKDFHRSDRKVTWLEPLSLDPMPSGTNLTAAVLARIHAHASRDDPGSRTSGLLDPINHVDKAKHELESLQNNAVTSLEGNLEQRAGAIDADGFAVNAMDAERQKLQVAGKLNAILGSLAAGVAGNPGRTKGLFVLPVDDMDVRPSRAVQMLKLATMLSIPRLFFLFLGELEAIDQILFYQTQGEYIQLLGSALGGRKDIADSIEAKSNEIASSLLRKMLPPGQRIRLEPMTLGEALLYPRGLRAFDNEEASKPMLWSLLKDLTLPRKLAWSKGDPGPAPKDPTCSLYDLLCPSHPVGKNRDDDEEAAKTREPDTSPGETVSVLEKESHYDGANLLAGPPRQVSDLWHELRDVVEENKGKLQKQVADTERPRDTAKQVIRILVAALNSVVDEDPNPGVPVQSALKSAVTSYERTSSRLWELSPPDIQVVSTFGDRLDLTFDDEGLPLSRVIGQEVMIHELHARNPKADRAERAPLRLLGPRSRVAYKAAHDLIRMTGQGVVTKSFVHENRAEMACTIWDDGYSEPLKISWSSSDWSTFWHQDAYTALWNKGTAVVRRISNESAELQGPDLALLLLVYRVAAAVAATEARPGVDVPIEDVEQLFYPKRPSSGEKWEFEKHLALTTAFERLTGRLTKLIESVVDKRRDGEDDAEADLIDDVLLDIALLATPEVFEGLRSSRSRKEENRTVHTAVRSKLKDFGGELFKQGNRRDLLPRFHRLRLERIGAHIGTPIGLAFLLPAKPSPKTKAKPSPAVPVPAPMEALGKAVSLWFSAVSHLKCPPDMLKAFFQREERRRFPERLDLKTWTDANKRLVKRKPA